MNKKNIKKTLFIGLIIIFFCSGWSFVFYRFFPSNNIVPINQNITQQGDVVQLNYTLFVQINDEWINETGNGKVYIDDPNNTVPLMILQQFPDIKRTPNVGFYENLLGRTISRFSFTIASENGFDNPKHPYFYKELYYLIDLTAILYAPRTKSTPLFEKIGYFFPIAISIIITILLPIITRKLYFKSQNIIHSCNICKKTAQLQCFCCRKKYCRDCSKQQSTCTRFKRL